MRIARYSFADEVSFGIVTETTADRGSDPELVVAPLLGHPFGVLQPAGPPVPLADVRLLAPVLPSKVVAIGKNYADHAREMGGEAPDVPIVFLKPSTSVVGQGDAIAYPPQSGRVDYEGELAVVIGRLCRDVPADRWQDVVLGYTCANDVTARDLQKVEQQWGRAKGFDTFCPLGPWIETELDPSALRLTTTVDGRTVQDGTTADLLRPVGELIAHITEAMTLLPGDVILTGTPAGVGPLTFGQEVAVTIEGIGTLANRVVARG